LACPAAQAIGAFVDGLLEPDRVPEVEAHVEACQVCFALLIAAASAASNDAGPADSRAPRPASTALEDLSFGPASDAPWSEPLADLRLEYPDSIGPYWITGLLGRGGMGVVYRGQHESTGRSAAVKTVRVASRAAFIAIRQEIAFLKAARHPGIVEIVDYDLTGAHPWYAMELLQGETMAERIAYRWHVQADGERTLDPSHLREILSLFGRLCPTLAFVHRAGIVHCDLKPNNVFIRGADQPVLMDFGLVAQARGAIGREALQGDVRIGGTLPYLSPEVIRGRLPDARADIYALGCMLYEALTGKPPFSAGSDDELLDKHLRSVPRPPGELVSGIPPELEALTLRMLQKRAHDRLGHAEDVLRGLVAAGAPAELAQAADEAARPGYLFRPQLVGRDEVMAAVLDRCERALEGEGALVLLEGESGIGKTFFASELCQRVQRKGLQVIKGECSPPPAAGQPGQENGGLPLHSFRELLEALGDHCREHSGGETARLLGPKLRLLTAYEPSLAHVPDAQNWPEMPALPASAARERLVRTVVDALAALAGQRPLLVTLDDLQWADGLSLSVLEALDEDFFKRAPLVLVATCRNDEPRAAVERVFARSFALKLRLERLGQLGVLSMVSDMLAMAAPPESLVHFVHAHSEGNPFFVAEYLRAVTAEGLLTRTDGHWQLSAGAMELPSVSFPTTLAGLVERRLDGLGPSALAVVQAAAVLGREFEPDLIERMLGEAVGPAIAELVDRQMIHAALEGRHRFLHDKLREVAYRQLSPAGRRRLHQAAATAIENKYRDQVSFGEQFGALANHWRAAGEPLRTMDYLERAGDRALGLSADAEAARLFREALALDTTQGGQVPAARRARWERQLGDAMQGLGQMAESATALSRAAALVGCAMPKSRVGIGLRIVGSLVRQTRHRLLPRPVPAGSAADPVLAEAGRIFDRLQRAYFYSGQDVPALLASLVGLNLLERGAPTPELATAYGNAGAMASIVPARKLSRAYFDRALATLEKAPDAAVESYIRMMLAVQHLGLGDRVNATIQAEQGLALADEIGFFRRAEECLAIRAAIEIVAGHHLRAQPWLYRLEASAARRGDQHMLCWALLEQTQCLILSDDLPDTEETLARAGALLPGLGHPENIWALSLRSYLAWRRGDLQGAAASADLAAQRVAVCPPVHTYCIDAHVRLAEVRIELLRAGGTRTQSRASLAAARRAGAVLARVARLFAIARPMARLQLARFSWGLGRRGRAIAGWRRGLQEARAMALPLPEAQLSVALAEVLPDASPERQQLLERARLLFHELAIVSGLDEPLPGRLTTAGRASRPQVASPTSPVHPAE
jgi:hypothetical protein